MKLLSSNLEYRRQQDEIQREHDRARRAARAQSRTTLTRPPCEPVVNTESSQSSRRVVPSAPSSQVTENIGVRRGDAEGDVHEEANGQHRYYPNNDGDGALEAAIQAKDLDDVKGQGKPNTSM